MGLSTWRLVAWTFTSIALLAGCSSSTEGTKTNPQPGSEDTELGGFTVALQGFRDAKGTDIEDPNGDPAYTSIIGQVYDGTYPELFVETALDIPADATEGCVVYAVAPPDCSNIGGCGAGSSDKDCAAAAASGQGTCVCIATDQCGPYPTKKNLGKVTVRGIADQSGVTTLELKNLSNSYQVPATTKLAYPGFAEGDSIEFTASGGDYEAFTVSAPGIAPLNLTNKPYNLAKDTSNADPTAYRDLTVTWTPPGPDSTSSIVLEIDISRHMGTVGFLACELADNGEVTISGSLVSQLVALGNVGGYPELTMSRWTSGTTQIAQGVVNAQIESNAEPGLTMDGYTSCLSDSDCLATEICNRDNKLCQAR